jgi:uncharacterized tellurite resistance protein B-like protein
MSQERIGLRPHEQLAFAGLARLLIRADGTFTSEEAAALQRVASGLLSTPGQALSPYRQAPEPTVDTDAIWELLDRASVELPDNPSVEQAALGVVRPEARTAIYEALYEIAASDVVTGDEWPLLDWLAETWVVEADGNESSKPPEG